MTSTTTATAAAAAPAATSGCFESLYLDPASEVKPPLFEGTNYLLDGKMLEWKGKVANVYSPIYVRGSKEPTRIGSYPMMAPSDAVAAVEAAHRAYDYGRGVWPQMTTKQRIEHVEKFLKGIRAKRDEIVHLLMWEICKTAEDAAKEVDRTIQYVQDTIKELKKLENASSSFTSDGGVIAQIRRAPLGVVLCSGPFNYPFNETYTTLIPSIIMGNTVVMKLPRCGVLCHFPTFPIFQECFPPGVLNIVSGSGRETMPHMMTTGKLDVFAFIGTSQAADALQKAHPKPHRLRVCLGLEAKNPAIVLPDADLDVAVAECVLGSLSFNGQRCTAIKIVWVHESIAEQFIPRFVQAIDNLKMGLPWEAGVRITPLPEEGKPGYLKTLVEDAVSKGARVLNTRHDIDRTFVAPTVISPVTKDMRAYHEEQFGPLVPVATFSKLEDVFEYLASSPYGQQAAIFGKNTEELSKLIDVLVNMVSRVNINAQCQRGPDSYPFTGRKDSAYGTLSVYDALRVFSLRALVATKDNATNQGILHSIVDARSSNFLRLEHLF